MPDGAIPLSATLVVTPSPLAAAERSWTFTLAVHRHVSVYQYLVIPACSGALLAALLVAFAPVGGAQDAAVGRRTRTWTRGFLATAAVRGLRVDVGRQLGHEHHRGRHAHRHRAHRVERVAALLPGVDQGRFSLLLAMAGGVSVIAPLLFAR